MAPLNYEAIRYGEAILEHMYSHRERNEDGRARERKRRTEVHGAKGEKIEMWEMRDEAGREFEKWEPVKATQGMCRYNDRVEEVNFLYLATVSMCLSSAIVRSW